jgi:CBS domain-containing protein
MKAQDVMTTTVVTVGPDTAVMDIAKLLLERHISGVPVVEDGKVIGMVSEGDLIHRPEIGTDKHGTKRWLGMFTSESPEQFIRIHGLKARDIMSPEVIAVEIDTPISEIADLFESRNIKRVPVISDGKLVGIVSRANLVKALTTVGEAIGPVETTDDTIWARLIYSLESHPWWSSMTSSVTVDDGVVHYWGLNTQPGECRAARVAAEEIAGVKKVEDHRKYRGNQFVDV